MNRREFVSRLAGRSWRFTRTCLVTGRVDDDETLIAREPKNLERSSSITLKSIHIYNDKDLFTEEYGVLVGVVKTGAGHLFCDRFVPAEEPSLKGD